MSNLHFAPFPRPFRGFRCSLANGCIITYLLYPSKGSKTFLTVNYDHFKARDTKNTIIFTLNFGLTKKHPY